MEKIKTEVQIVKETAKELGIKPDKDLLKAAKGMDETRAIIKNAKIELFKDFMQDRR
ncbi:MAG: hypothetical protein LBT79_07055 [Elusimicrobiota bacterium]|jgi:hypothetical protein|nr:hypothetical protein [Elusimicrobiota bacterium]